METQAIIQGVFTHGISHVVFSNDGTKLAAVAMDPNHCICVYDLNGLLNQS